MKKIYLFLLIVVFSTEFVSAQQGLATYTPSRTTGITFTSISGTGTSFPSWRNTTTSTDDNMSTAVPIGFNFLYDGVQVCEVNVSTNGFLNLLTSTSATGTGTGAYGYSNAAFSNSTLRVLAPFYDDLITQGNPGTIAGLNNSMFYQTTGTSPNRVFTVEWKNFETFGNAGADLNFQVKLFEGTNKISFVYGTMTPPASSPSYSLGINSISLSGTFTTAMLFTQQTNNTATFGSTAQDALNTVPATNSQIDFTYASAAPVPLSGVYTIPGSYATIGAAINALNYNGTSGACTFNVAAGSIFNENPSPIQTTCASAAITFQKSGAGNNPKINATTGGLIALGAAIRIMGGDNITFDGIDIGIASGTALNYGFLLTQNSNTNGAQNNIIQNAVITLDRSNVNSIGIITSSVLTPANVAGGAISGNIFRNISVKNSYRGILFNGGTTVTYGGLGTINCSPDNNNQLTSTACGTYNLIGDPTTPNDLGGSSTTVNPFGVAAFSQANLTIANTKIQNVTSSSTIYADGLYISNNLPAATSGGTTNVFNNQIYNISTTSASGGVATGLSLNNNNNAGSVIRAYNNFIGNINSNSTSTAGRRIVGIGVQDEGTTSNLSSMAIWHNSVSLTPSGTACSNACIETSLTTTGPVIDVRNNIFANFTGAQAGLAKHYAIVSPSATVWGNTGSISNYNDLYVSNTTNGYVGLGSATDYATLANWNTGMGGTIDVPGQSISTDPFFSGSTDLHATAVLINNTGTVAPAYITSDIDCQPRPQPVATNFDMGADETEQCTGVPSGGVITPGSATICQNQTYTMNAVGATTGIGITLQWQVSPTGGGVGFVNVTGGSASNSNPYTTAPLATGTYYYRLRVTCAAGPTTVFSNELQVTVNPAPTVTVSPTSGFLCQPGATPISLTGSGAVTYSWSPSTGLSAITGATVSANPQLTTVYTVTGTAANSCTSSATTTITVGSSFTLVTTATPPAVCTGGNSQLNAVVNSNSNEILITEVTLFRTGTGQTPTYPAYIGGSDADFVELSNISGAAVDISGWTISDYPNNSAVARHPYTFPVGSIIPAGSVAVVHLGSGTTSLPNLYFNTGGTTDSWFSGDNIGVVLKNGATVVDAVGVNAGYTFNAGTGVTGADWTGAAISPGTFAGPIRTGASDTNTGSDWAQSNTPTPLQSIGTYNGGYVTALTIATWSWAPATFLSATNIANPIATAVTATTNYTVTATSTAGCQATGNVSVTVAPLVCTSITSTGNRCAGSPASYTVNTTGGCAPYTYTWTIDGSAFAGNTPTITPTLAAGPHLFAVTVTSASGNCNTSASFTTNALPAVSVTPATSSICNPGGAAVALTASGASSYSWNPSTGLSAITGASVNANPTSSIVYTVTGTDANGCVNTGTATVNVGSSITETVASSAAGTICPGTNSTTLTATVTFPALSYCNSRHDNGCALGDEITNVQILTTTLNYTSSPACAPSAYSYFNGGGSQTGTLSPGGYTISATFGSDANQYFGAWIDYNRDGVFAVSEFLGASGNAGANGTTSFAFTVPAGALNGVTRLRVVGGNDAVVTAGQACDASSSTFGETEDYDVTITGGVSPVTYAWSPATFLSSTTTNPTTTVNMTSTQTYTVTATTAAGCTAQASVAVNVYPAVTGTISGAATICVGGSTIMSVALTGTAPWSITYTANGASPVTVSGINTSPYTFSVSPIVNTTYELSAVSDATICTGTFSGTPLVTVNADPTITVSPAAPSYCPGGSVSLTASGATSYTWSPAGGLSATTGATVTANPAATSTYTITGTDPLPGCSGTANVTVTVNPNLPVSVSIVSSSGTDICVGETVTFTATPTNGGASPTYQWYNGATPISGETNSTYVTSTLVNGDVISVQLTSNATCPTGNPATSNTITMNVIASGAASVTLTPSAILCSGTPITFTANPVNGGPTPNYQFFLNGGSIQNGASNTYTLAAPANGNTVYVIMTSSLSCATGNPATSATYTVALNPSPTNTAPTPTCTSIYAGNNTTLTNAAAAGSGSIASYQWVLNGVTNVGAGLSTYTTGTTGSYTVIVTNTNGCSTTSLPVLISPNIAPLNAGTYNIPGSGGCTDFVTIAAAVNHLSTYGIANNGNVIFNIAGGHLETAPVGGYAITGLGTGTAGNTITFKKASGANPIITAGLQSAGSNTDAIFKLIGADYITIQDLTLEENTNNIVGVVGATNTKTEWAIALLHDNATPGNGAQNNTIQNNIISLDRTYPNSFGVYSNARHSATIPANLQDATGANGRNSFNKVYGNAISNVNTPIVFIGAITNQDATNDIGGAGAPTANTISNWGSNTINSGNTTFNSVPSTMVGIYTANQTSLNVSWNSIVSAASINVGASGIRGILNDYTTGGSPSGTFTNTISNNTVSLNSAGTTGAFEAIAHANTSASAALAGYTLNINNNNIINNAVTGAASSSVLTGITNAFPAGILSISGNTIRSNTSTATTVGITGISNSAAVPTSITIDNNKFGDASGDFINFSAATTGAVSGILNTGGAATAALSIQTNDFRRIVYGAASASANTYISNTAATLSQNISSNTFTNINLNTTTGNVTFISNAVLLPAAGVQTVSNNAVVTGFTKTGSGGTIQFYLSSALTSNTTSTITCSNNNFSNMSFIGSQINGWVVGDLGPANKTISNNTFANITNTTGNVTIINATGTATAPGTAITGNTVGPLTVAGTNIIGISVPTSAGGRATVTGNTITGITGNAGTPTITCISSGAPTSTISTNTITGISSLVTVTGINMIAGTSTSTLNGNIINTMSSSGSGTRVDGINVQEALTSITISNNQLNTFTHTGITTSAVNGIRLSTGTSIVLANINGNTINGFVNSGGTTSPLTSGINLVGGTQTTVNIDRNKIYDLAQNGNPSATTNSLVNGITLGTGTNVRVSNNFISDLKAPASGNCLDAIRGINVSATGANTTFNVYYNTVYLKASSSGTNFGSSAIFHTSQVTATTATLNLRNNIFDNQSTANGTGFTAAYRRSSGTFGNYAATSNNNLFYAGTPQSAPRVIYLDNSTLLNDATLAAYKTRVGAPRDAASISLMPNYVNGTTTPYDLKLKDDFNCSIDGQGNNSGILIADDNEATGVRSTTNPFITDIGADEFTATGSGAGVWRGVDSDWLNVNNWCGEVPTATTNVTIPTGRPFYPIITTSAPVVRDITVDAGGTITITGVGKLAVYGAISTSGTFNALDGTIEMAGSAPQTIPAAAFQNNDIKNLVINNASVTLAGALDLFGKLSFTGSNRTFATAGFLTLKSTATGTASVGDITNAGVNVGNTITGDVMTERFATARRAWRLLSPPTQHNLQTIKEAWQENQAANATTPAGFGINITSNRASWSTDGFDQFTAPGPSVKTYNPATNVWDGIISTVNVVAPTPNNGRFVAGKAYMALVRGDRTVNVFPAAATTTVLREKGALITNNFVFPGGIGAGQFAAVGNPYASAVDFSKLTKTNLQDVYYLWDPQLGSLGAYQTFLGPGPVYSVTPGGGSYGGGNQFIESGTGFFVHSSGPAGTLTFTENSKVDGSNLVTRTTGPVQQLRTNLKQVDNSGTAVLHDGVLNQYDAAYSNNVDELDAIKLGNFGESIGISQGDKVLVVERRDAMMASDTIFYKMGQLKAQNYQFEFIPENVDQFGLEAFLEDVYLNTKTPVSLTGTTNINFTIINEPGSYASDRFRLVFKQLRPVPVTFVDIRAEKQNKDILVTWKVENELNIQYYEIEHSTDGRNFVLAGTKAATGNGTTSIVYNWLDVQAAAGNHFYRIRSVGNAGEIKYSRVAKVTIDAAAPVITVYPNPVKEDGILQVSMSNVPAGVYKASIINNLGQTLLRKTLNHTGGNNVYTIRLDKTIAHGHYNLELSDANNVKTIFKVLY